MDAVFNPVDPAVAALQVTGAAGRTVAVGVEGQRAKEIEPPSAPSVVLTMDLETFTCVGCGRWDPAKVLEDGKVKISGDLVLGEKIVSQMNFMI